MSLAPSVNNDFAFKVSNPETGKEYKIFTDGRIEGFDDPACVINKIPQILTQKSGHEAMLNAQIAWLVRGLQDIARNQTGDYEHLREQARLSLRALSK